MPESVILSPAPSLREFVARYVVRQNPARDVVRPVTASPHLLWVFHFDGITKAFEHRTGHLRVMPRCFLVGPQTGRRAELIHGGGRASLVVQFTPTGFHRLFHVNADTLADVALDAADVVGPDVTCLYEQMAALPAVRARVRAFEQFLQVRLATARPAHPVADAAARLLASHGRHRVADVARATGLSERRFERAFVEQVGVTPKLFARAARLDYALELKRDNPQQTWTRVSQEAGYFDQTHFVKDFKALAGDTPSTFPLAEVPAFYYHRRLPSA